MNASLQRIARNRVVELSAKIEKTIELRAFKNDEERKNYGALGTAGKIAVTGAGAVGAVAAGGAIKKDYDKFKGGHMAAAGDMRSSAVMARGNAYRAGRTGVISETAVHNKIADGFRASAEVAEKAATPTGYIRSRLGLAKSAVAPVTDRVAPAAMRGSAMLKGLVNDAVEGAKKFRR